MIFRDAHGGEWDDVSFSQRFRRLRTRCVRLNLIKEEKNGEKLVLYSTRHTRSVEMIRDEGIDVAIYPERWEHSHRRHPLRPPTLEGQEMVTIRVTQLSRVAPPERHRCAIEQPKRTIKGVEPKMRHSATHPPSAPLTTARLPHPFVAARTSES